MKGEMEETEGVAGTDVGDQKVCLDLHEEEEEQSTLARGVPSVPLIREQHWSTLEELGGGSYYQNHGGATNLLCLPDGPE